MSIVSSLVLVLLCLISYQACNARNPGVVHKETAKDYQHTGSKKNENSAKVSIQHGMRTSTPKASRGAKEEGRFEKEKVSETNDPTAGIQEAKGVGTSGTRQTESPISSVSWKAPHDKKRGEAEPGFNLDYLPPKTHPPIHN